MGYTVKQVAGMSGVSVRTLHFYDETGLLKPSRQATNGYRLYEEAQLLTLQQILFYRELGLELKQIKEVLSRPDFEKLNALQSHRTVLQQRLSRTRILMETIDKTMGHLKGEEKVNNEEIFAGFSVSAGKDRFNDPARIGGAQHNCKVSGSDTAGAMCVIEVMGTSGGPRHLHREQDEWVYVIEGEFQVEVGTEKLWLGPGESVFLPRNVPHGTAPTSKQPGKTINVYQPAGRIEEFFREVDKHDRERPIHEVMLFEEFCRLFHDHGIDVVGPPIVGEWKVDEDGRIVQMS